MILNVHKIVLFSLKNVNITCEVHIYLRITELYQQLRELSIVDSDKELVREDFFETKTMIVYMLQAG